MSTYVLKLPWTTPPLTANQRLQWWERAKRTREIRETVAWLAKAARIPTAENCTVTLIWVPKHRRKRDDDNPFLTLKAAADGIVDAKIVPDDTSYYMTKPTPVIRPPADSAAMWLEVTVTAPKTAVTS